MRQSLFLCAIAIGLCLAWSGSANAGAISWIELDFANTPGARLSFNGQNSTFTFLPDASGHEFQINNVSGGSGSALGLFGTITGTYTIGSIVNNHAPVTGSGVVTISDGSHSLTANISLVAVDKPNALGVLNPDELVNLSNVHYTGTNEDLQALASGLNPTALLSFFDSHSLAQLKAGGRPVNTGFAGSFTATPEPATMMLFLGMAPALWVIQRRRKAADAIAG